MKAVGAFSVKSYNQPRRDARQKIIKAARELQMMVVPEGGSLFYHNKTMVVDGHTGVEHSLPVPKLYKDVVTLFAQEQDRLHADADRRLRRPVGRELLVSARRTSGRTSGCSTFMPRDVIDARSRRRTMAPDDDFNHFADRRRARSRSSTPAARVQLGAHGQLQGLGAHWELWMLAQGGMTPLEALRCATHQRRALPRPGQGHRLARAGQARRPDRARRQPAREHPQQRERSRWSMLNGRLYDATTMNEIGNHPKSAPGALVRQPVTCM